MGIINADSKCGLCMGVYSNLIGVCGMGYINGEN